jgi:hypothetical protein
MCAFSIDIGYIILAQTDLQNAADSAALAGAEPLQNLFVQYNSPGITQAVQNQILTTATTNVAPSGNVPGSPMYVAEQFAQLNAAGGVYITVPDSDVTFGYTDGNGNYSTTYTGFPNTISVTTRRDDTANTPLQLFFGPIFNKSSQSLTATARATIYSGDVTSLKPLLRLDNTPIDAHILPVALDVNIWKQFYATGLSPDGTMHVASNGNPQLHVYPFDTNTPGSFGLVDVGPAQNNAPAFRSWIDTGQTPNDINYLLNNGLLPVTIDAPQPWKVGPGLKSTLLADFQSQMGAPNKIPLFIPAQLTPTYIAATGNGQNATYSICGMVGITISQAEGNGNNMDISIQPMGNIDPTSVFSNPAPAGTALSSFGTSPTTFLSAKITR